MYFERDVQRDLEQLANDLNELITWLPLAERRRRGRTAQRAWKTFKPLAIALAQLADREMDAAADRFSS
jgi:hypothetical protein